MKWAKNELKWVKKDEMSPKQLKLPPKWAEMSPKWAKETGDRISWITVKLKEKELEWADKASNGLNKLKLALNEPTNYVNETKRA